MIEFLRPAWLLAAPAVVLVYLLWRRRGRDSPWRAVVDPELLPHLMVGHTATRARWPWVLLALAYLAAVLALAGPSLEWPERSAMTRVQARVIVLDLSPSMDTADVSPSRLDRARFKIRDLLERPGDVQHALVVFSGDAFTVSPVTADSATLLNLLDALSTDMMPVAGNRLDRAVDVSLALLRRAADPHGEVLLVTDGVGGAGGPPARRLREAGATLDVLSVGTREGAPIRGPDGSFIKDHDGNIVIRGVRFEALESLAAAGGGRAAAMTLDEADLDALERHAGSLETARAVIRDEPVSRRRDLGAYLVWLLLPAAAMAFRRGWLLVVLPLMVFPPPSQALSWQDLWSRPDQQAAQDVGAGRYAAAAGRGDTPWRGAALYKQGDYAGAARAFAGRNDADGQFNLANALARSGDLRGALEAYQRALALDAGAEDIRHNRDLVKRLLENDASRSPRGGGQGDESGEGQDGAGSEGSKNSANDAAGRSSGDDAGAGQREPPADDQGEAANARDASGDGRQPDASSHAGKEPAGQPGDDAGERSGAARDRGQEQDAATGSHDADDSSGDREQPPSARGENHGADESTEAGASLAGDGDDLRARQALEQWLRRVPDDPEGLLRRKFLHQYRQRTEQSG